MKNALFFQGEPTDSVDVLKRKDHDYTKQFLIISKIKNLDHRNLFDVKRNSNTIQNIS